MPPKGRGPSPGRKCEAMRHPVCPDPSELAAFALGNLPRPAFTRLEGHLEECSSCAQALEALDGLTDNLLGALRSPAYQETTTLPYVSPVLLATARVLPGEEGPAAPWPRRLGKFE